MIVEVGKSKICRPAWQAGNLRQDFYITALRQNSFSGKSHFFAVKPSVDEMRPTHIIKGNLLKVN